MLQNSHKYSNLDQKHLVRLYTENHFSIEKIAKLNKCPRKYVEKSLRSAGINIQPHGVRITQEQVEQWKNLYERKMSLRDIARLANVSIETIRLNLKRNGVVLNRRGAKTKNLDIDNLILLYKNGKKIKELAAINKTTVKNISEALKNHGVVVRRKGKHNKLVDQDLINDWVRLYKTNSTKKIGDKYGFSPLTVVRYLRHSGVNIKKPGFPRKYSFKTVQFWEDLYLNQHKSLQEICEMSGANILTVKKYLNQQGLFLREKR